MGGGVECVSEEPGVLGWGGGVVGGVGGGVGRGRGGGVGGWGGGGCRQEIPCSS